MDKEAQKHARIENRGRIICIFLVGLIITTLLLSLFASKEQVQEMHGWIEQMSFWSKFHLLSSWMMAFLGFSAFINLGFTDQRRDTLGFAANMFGFAFLGLVSFGVIWLGFASYLTLFGSVCGLMACLCAKLIDPMGITGGK